MDKETHSLTQGADSHRCPEFVTQDLPTSIVGYKSEIVGSEQKYFFIL